MELIYLLPTVCLFVCLLLLFFRNRPTIFSDFCCGTKVLLMLIHYRDIYSMPCRGRRRRRLIDCTVVVMYRQIFQRVINCNIVLFIELIVIRYYLFTDATFSCAFNFHIFGFMCWLVRASKSVDFSSCAVTECKCTRTFQSTLLLRRVQAGVKCNKQISHCFGQVQLIKLDS